MFKNKGLDIIKKYNLKIVDYLEVTLNLKLGSYGPYKKPNEETNYRHVNSSHSPSILIQIPLYQICKNMGVHLPVFSRIPENTGN